LTNCIELIKEELIKPAPETGGEACEKESGEAVVFGGWNSIQRSVCIVLRILAARIE
jgi:hypothetical protein